MFLSQLLAPQNPIIWNRTRFVLGLGWEIQALKWDSACLEAGCPSVQASRCYFVFCCFKGKTFINTCYFLLVELLNDKSWRQKDLFY